MTTHQRITHRERKGEREDLYVMEESRSNPGRYHFVDVEAEKCSCPATVRRCYHVRKHQCAYCDGMGTFISYPRLMTCQRCAGTGLAA